MDRRRFLKVGAVGGGALVAAGGAVALQPGELRYAPRGPLQVLDASRFNVVAMVAARTAGTPDVDPVTVAHAADAALLFVSEESRAELSLAIGLLENGLSGLLLRGSARPFSSLDAAAQDRAIDRWLDSRVAMVRGAGQALRKLTLASYYAPLEVARTTGYPGPLFDKPDPGPIAPRAALSEPYVPRLAARTGTTAAGADPAAPGTSTAAAPAPAEVSR